MKRVTVAILALVGILLTGSHLVRASQQVPPNYTIVPGVRIGDITLGMSKDDVLKTLGKPKFIYIGGENYTLDNLPTLYRLHYGYIEFEVNNNIVRMIKTRSPSYRFSNGVGVDDSIEKIKKTFGDFDKRGNVISYDDRGVGFEINEKDNRTIGEIAVFRPTEDRDGSDGPDSDDTVRSHNPLPGPLVFPKIDRRPQPDDDRPEEMKRLPRYDPDSDSPWQMDLRGRDLSKLDLRNSIDDLLYTTFDDRTVWPASDKMPSDFDRQEIIELGKNPGLGVRSLHKKGITGRDVRIAIIDQPLLVDHQEYANRLQLYEEIHIKHGTGPQMHGPAVASIAVGNTVGVAPEAELFYIAQFNFDWEKDGAPTFRYLAHGIYRIVEINEQLPQDKKIRAISISRGWTRNDLRDKKYSMITEAVQKARAAGMLVVTCSVDLVHEGCDYAVLGRPPLADPDVFESYEPGLFTAKWFWARNDSPSQDPDDNFFVPIDSRATASPKGIDEYAFYRQGGSSWAPPYIAGVYAMAVQVDPSITPERFWALAAKTGCTIEVKRNGKRRRLGPIIDPVRLIRSIQAGELSNKNQIRNDSQQSNQVSGDGFVSMFDGKTLAGWHAVPKDSASDWTVSDGAIVGWGSADRQAYLVWKDQQLTDFELRFRYRLLTRGNTGVELRCRHDPSGKRPFEGYHADLGHVGIGPHILGAWDFHFARRTEYPCPRGTRLVIDEDGRTQSSTIPDALKAADVRRGQWNDVRVIARGNHFRFFVNDKLASEFIDNAEHGRLTQGAIGLQLHDKGMHVEFKDLYLKRL